jgi:hypothetical protein
MKLFFYPHAGMGNSTGKILWVRVQVRMCTARQVRTRCHLEFCVVGNWKGEERGDAERRLAGMGYGLWATAYSPLELNSRGLEAYEATTGVRFPFFQSRKKLGVGVSRFVLTEACFV